MGIVLTIFMQQNKIYFHGFQAHADLVKIINKMQDMEIPFQFVNQQTPKNIVERFKNVQYNPNTHFLCLIEIDGHVNFSLLDSMCSFKKFFNNCTAEIAEVVN